MGYEPDKLQWKMFELCEENTLKRKANELFENEYNERKLQKIKRDEYRRRSRHLIACSVVMAGAIVGSVSYAGYVGVNAVKNHKDFLKAKEYMNMAMDFVSPDVKRGVLEDGTVILFDDDVSSYIKICSDLQKEPYNLSRDCAIYCISSKYGKDAFDSVCQSYGYIDSDDFLYQLYPKSVNNSSTAETSFQNIGDYHKFENNVQVELVKKFGKLKEYTKNEVEETRGMRR